MAETQRDQVLTRLAKLREDAFLPQGGVLIELRDIDAAIAEITEILSEPVTVESDSPETWPHPGYSCGVHNLRHIDGCPECEAGIPGNDEDEEVQRG